MNTGSFLSAVAATTAAVLAAINLYIAGRRERNRWAREVLIDVFVTFLNAGFDGSSACNRLIESGGAGSQQNKTDYWGIIVNAHHAETEMLTKMRLLTSPRMVEAALNLHLATHTCARFIQKHLPLIPEDENRAVYEQLWQARRLFLAAAKREIGLEEKVSSATHGPTP